MLTHRIIRLPAGESRGRVGAAVWCQSPMGDALRNAGLEASPLRLLRRPALPKHFCITPATIQWLGVVMPAYLCGVPPRRGYCQTRLNPLLFFFLRGFGLSVSATWGKPTFGF